MIDDMQSLVGGYLAAALVQAKKEFLTATRIEVSVKGVDPVNHIARPEIMIWLRSGKVLRISVDLVKGADEGVSE
jgi:hypothetical protein